MIINRKFIFGVIVMFSLVTFNEARGLDDATSKWLTSVGMTDEVKHKLQSEIAEHDWYLKNCLGPTALDKTTRCIRGYEKWGR